MFCAEVREATGNIYQGVSKTPRRLKRSRSVKKTTASSYVLDQPSSSSSSTVLGVCPGAQASPTGGLPFLNTARGGLAGHCCGIVTSNCACSVKRSRSGVGVNSTWRVVGSTAVTRPSRGDSSCKRMSSCVSRSLTAGFMGPGSIIGCLLQVYTNFEMNVAPLLTLVTRKFKFLSLKHESNGLSDVWLDS